MVVIIKNMEESILKAFEEHLSILKRLNAFSVTDMRKSLFKSKEFYEFVEYDILSYNETAFIRRLIDGYMYNPNYSKEQKGFFISTLNSKLRKAGRQKYLDVPDYIDWKSRIEFIEEQNMALGHVILSMMFDNSLKENQVVRKLLHDYIATEPFMRIFFVRENFDLLPIRKQKEAAKAVKKQLKRKLSLKLVWPIIDANTELMQTSKEDFERKISRDMLFDKLENDILEICVRLMERKNTKRIENLLNDDITDHLRTKGYQVSDQTRSGKSGTGKQAGSLDIMIRDSKNLPLTIIEAMRLSSLGAKNSVLNNHIIKLLDNYDTSKLSIKYIVIFCEAAKFVELTEKYYFFLTKFNDNTKGRYKLDSVGSPSKPFGNSVSSIRTINSFSRVNGVFVKLKHILLDMK